MKITILIIMIMVQLKRRKDKYVGLSFLVLNLKDNEQLSIMKRGTLRTVAEPPLSTHFSPEMSFLYRSANEDFFYFLFSLFYRDCDKTDLLSLEVAIPNQINETTFENKIISDNKREKSLFLCLSAPFRAISFFTLFANWIASSPWDNWNMYNY